LSCENLRSHWINLILPIARLTRAKYSLLSSHLPLSFPFRLGKKPSRADARTLRLAKYLRQGLARRGETALAPAPPATDNGAVELDVLNYWRQQGIAGHKIDAYAAFDADDLQTVRQAVALFGGAYIGLALPLSARQQAVWDVPSLWSRLRNQDAPGSWGGHAVPVLAYDPDGLTCITWGAKKRMTWQFFAQYCNEAYAPLSHDWLTAQGKDPEGLDMATLEVDLSRLQSAPRPQ
jgi:hypothetical protein